MDEDVKLRANNNSMKSQLLVADNIPAIEDLLDKESRILQKLQKLKENGRLDFGKTVPLMNYRSCFRRSAAKWMISYMFKMAGFRISVISTF